MTVELIRSALAWCTVINYGILLLWFIFFVFAHDWIYHMHSRWYKISVERFDSIHYAGLAFFKVIILVFNLAPYLALRILA